MCWYFIHLNKRIFKTYYERYKNCYCETKVKLIFSFTLIFRYLKYFSVLSSNISFNFSTNLLPSDVSL
jgi:hypothetical protein